MPAPRLGAAAVDVSISDTDGFRVLHKDGSVLMEIPADQLQPGDWQLFWSGIDAVQTKVAMRSHRRDGAGSALAN